MTKAHSLSLIQPAQDWFPSWPNWKIDLNEMVSDGEVHFNKIPLLQGRTTLSLTAPLA